MLFSCQESRLKVCLNFKYYTPITCYLLHWTLMRIFKIPVELQKCCQRNRCVENIENHLKIYLWFHHLENLECRHHACPLLLPTASQNHGHLATHLASGLHGAFSITGYFTARKGAFGRSCKQSRHKCSMSTTQANKNFNQTSMLWSADQ